jgi:hypothetical protein
LLDQVVGGLVQVSRVYIRAIDKAGESETVGEVPNSWLFHVAIWGGMMRIHGIHSGYTHDLKTLGKLWSRVAKLPRADGLLVAATFDRCWFPIHIVPELVGAMYEEQRFDSNLRQVADVVARRNANRTRGYAFSGSIASPWSCPKTDELHVLEVDKSPIRSRAGHQCKNCGAQIQNAEHTLADEECCREPEDYK